MPKQNDRPATTSPPNNRNALPRTHTHTQNNKTIIERVGATVVEAACVIEIPCLKGRDKLKGVPLHVLISKDLDE